MRLLDTDVMVDILRAFPQAIEWLASLGNEELVLPGFVVLELLDGCSTKRETKQLQKRIQVFRIHWPKEEDCNRALADFAHFHLSHHLSMMDALIAECAIGLDCSLCTFNQKHFKPLVNLSTEQPYSRR